MLAERAHAALLVAACAALTACGARATAPARAAEPRAPARALVPPTRAAVVERAAGDVLERLVLAGTPPIDDPAIEAYVASVGARIAARCARADVRFTFRVLDDVDANAYALPAGHVFVTRGALAELGSEAELAAVLGHEVGHVCDKHATRSAPAWATGLPDPRRDALEEAEQSRDDERQADLLGARYVAEAGYPPAAMLVVLDRLGREDDGARDDAPAWSRTHPGRDVRLARAARAIALLPGAASVPPGASIAARYDGARAPAWRRDAYYAGIDGLVLGEDPRLGLVSAGRFVHPRGEFTFELAPGARAEIAGGTLTVRSSSGDAALTMLRARGGSSIFAGALRAVVAEHHPTTRERGGITVSLAHVAGADGGWIAVFTSGPDTYALVSPERHDALDRALSTLRRDPAAGAGVEPSRLHMR